MELILIFFTFAMPSTMFGFQGIMESKGITDPTFAFSLGKTAIILDVAAKLLIIAVYNYVDIDITSLLLIYCYSLLFFVFSFWIIVTLTIPKRSTRNDRKYPQETNYTLLAFKVVGWGLLSFLLNILFLSWIINFEGALAVIFMCAISLILNITMLILGAMALIRLDRLKYPSIRSLKGLSNNNSPIILLRSFQLDVNPSMSGKVFDETISENIDVEKTPIISLANPDEILPSGGSLKIQAKDSVWKEVVKQILKNCKAVILVEGLSEGLHWEISQLKEYLKPTQLFVIVPSKNYREMAWCYSEEAGKGLYSIFRNLHRIVSMATMRNRKDNRKILTAVWEDFAAKLKEFEINVPQSSPGSDSLIIFDDTWNGKKVENMHNMQSMLDYIIHHTNEFNNSNYDYQKLGEKVASYEVNGFLNIEELAPLKKIVNKWNRLGLILAGVLFLTSIVLLLI